MRRIALAVVTVLGLAACQQMVTEPAANPNPSIRMFGSNPPPPPIDSGSVGYSGTSGNFDFTLMLRYFANKTGNNGWLTLVETGGAKGDPNARVSNHQGDVSGNGSWFIPVNGGILRLDLGSIGRGSTFDRNKGSYDLLLGGVFYPGEGGDSSAVGDIHIIPGNPVRPNG